MKNVPFSSVFLKSLQGLQFEHASILDLKSRLRAGAMKAKKGKDILRVCKCLLRSAWKTRDQKERSEPLRPKCVHLPDCWLVSSGLCRQPFVGCGLP